MEARMGLGRYRVVLSYACPWNPTHLISPIVRVSPDVPFQILRRY
jgi:glutathionyl-hydroquinone reductase